MHGGKGGAPSGERNGNYRHGNYTQEAIAARKARVAVGREEMARLRELERLGRSMGLIRD